MVVIIWNVSRFFRLLIATLSRSLFNVFYIRLALDSSNWIKICLDSSSRILELCPLMSLYSLLVTLNKSMSSVSSLSQDYIFAVLVCLSFFWSQHCSVLALNIVDSPTVVFILIVSGQFKQALPYSSSFDQYTISSSLRKLFKPKKLERHWRSFVWKLISKPNCVLVVFIWVK